LNETSADDKCVLRRASSPVIAFAERLKSQVAGEVEAERSSEADTHIIPCSSFDVIVIRKMASGINELSDLHVRRFRIGPDAFGQGHDVIKSPHGQA